MLKIPLFKFIACLLILASFLTLMPVFAQTNDTAETTQLKEELERLQKEIEEYEGQLNSVRSEKTTLNQKIRQLRLEQDKVRAQIQQTDLNLKSTETRLLTVAQTMEEKLAEIETFEEQVAVLIRNLEKKDHYSWLEIMISESNFNDFFKKLGEYRQLTKGLEQAIIKLQSEKTALENQQLQLNENREEQRNLINIANLQNQQLASSLSERQNLLSETSSRESDYQAVLADRQKRAAQIRSRIYELIGATTNVSFGEAVEIAKWAEGLTGVRAAFLLAILTQESNLGKNVGTCNRPGDPPEKSWKVVMKPTRDQEPFLAITKELGLDPDVTPVSCPMRDKNGEQVGWGGAMGPAQFIPSTWLGYKDKVAALIGRPPNPWDIRDAFAASAVLLKANGATAEGGEWAAAMRYFSGGTNPAFSFYGDSVMALTEKYQADIDTLNE